MIEGETLVSLLVTLVIGGLIFWLLWWGLSYAKPPEPFNKVCRVVIALFAVLFLINVLLGLGGHPLVHWDWYHR